MRNRIEGDFKALRAAIAILRDGRGMNRDLAAIAAKAIRAAIESPVRGRRMTK